MSVIITVVIISIVFVCLKVIKHWNDDGYGWRPGDSDENN